MYEPTLPKLAMVKTRISAESWMARVETARRGGAVLEAILAREAAGEPLNEAIRQVVSPERRSWVIFRIRRFQQHGLEALIDTRVPREPKVAKQCGPLVEAARLANPKVTVDEVLSQLKSLRTPVLPSERTIRKHFARVDERTRYAKKKHSPLHSEELELAFAGGELLAAAELETNAVGALAQEVKTLGEEAVAASAGRTATRDVAHRDAEGHFTATYNARRRRKQGEQVASYLRTAEEKAAGRVPSWPRFVHERVETLLPKVWMLVCAPLVSGTKGWDALRAPDVAGLKALTGFAYMPSTLSKFTSALAVSGAGQRLLEKVGVHWHQVAQARWGEAGAMAALYVDNHAKEVWSSLFTQSGKVSHRNRVMPCITTTYMHTGAGTPLVASVQSGAAPLAPRLVELVKEAEAALEGEVRRAVVIDAEGSTFDILNDFAREGRVIVTPLRPSRAPELELRYSKGSYYRPYRENDELRVASATLLHRSTGRSLEVGALLVRSARRESDTVLLTTGLALGHEGRELADLYFSRWAIQENFFRDGAAVALNEHRGNCGRMVANVAVMTELERLQRREEPLRQAQQCAAAESPALEAALVAASRANQRAVDALAVRRGRLDALVAAGRTEGKQLGRVAVEHQAALVRGEGTARAFNEARQALESAQDKASKSEGQLASLEARRAHLLPQRLIRELDVAQDSVLTAMKLTLAQLIAFALREYLTDLPMSPQTFVSRVFSLRGSKELSAEEERIVFHANPRDPEVCAALAGACKRLNARKLVRDGRRLRYAVEETR